jgi:outer membrane protein TolC
MHKKIDFDSAENYPVVGAHVEYGFSDDKITLESSQDYYLAAVGLKYTLFDGFVTSVKEQKAKIEYQKVQHYYSYMKDGISLEVKKNFLEAKTLKKVLKDKTNVAIMAEDILNETMELYSNNLRFRTNMMYLLMQLENMIKAQADVAMTKYNKALAQANLELSLGNSLDQ